MKLLAIVVLSCLTALVSNVNADTITYKNGKTLRAIVIKQSDSVVTVNLYGQKIEIPRSLVKSVERVSAEENAALKERWEKTDRHHKSESIKSRDKATRRTTLDKRLSSKKPKPTTGDIPAPIVKRTPLPVRKPISDELLKTSYTKAKAKKPQPVSEQQEKFLWHQKVRKAIHKESVIPGMTEKEVQSAWGWPERTHPVHGIDTHTDRWTYRREGEGLVDLFFKNGILEQINR